MNGYDPEAFIRPKGFANPLWLKDKLWPIYHKRMMKQAYQSLYITSPGLLSLLANARPE